MARKKMSRGKADTHLVEDGEELAFLVWARLSICASSTEVRIRNADGVVSPFGRLLFVLSLAHGGWWCRGLGGVVDDNRRARSGMLKVSDQ